MVSFGCTKRKEKCNMHKNSFDIVMAHIEENVDRPTAEIKKENESGELD